MRTEHTWNLTFGLLGGISLGCLFAPAGDAKTHAGFILAAAAVGLGIGLFCDWRYR